MAECISEVKNSNMDVGKYFAIAFALGLFALAMFLASSANAEYITVQCALGDYDGEGCINDVNVHVENSTGANVSGAYVYIDGFISGVTNADGNATAYNQSEGRHEVVAANETMLDEAFFISEGNATVQDYIKLLAYAINGDGDGNFDDLKVVALNSTNAPIVNAIVVVDRVYVGVTNATGVYIGHNFERGPHVAEIFTPATHPSLPDKHAQGNFFARDTNHSFMFVRALLTDRDGTGKANDLIIYTGIYFAGIMRQAPVGGVDVAIDGCHVGKTAFGFLTVYNVSGGLHEVEAALWFDLGAEKLVLTAHTGAISLGDGVTPFLYIISYTTDMDSDGKRNDALLMAFHIEFPGGMIVTVPEENAMIFVDDIYAGSTASNGILVLMNLTEGDHQVTALKQIYGGLFFYASCTIYSEGNSTADFLKVWAMNADLDDDGIAYQNDLVVFVFRYHPLGGGIFLIQPIEGALVFVDGYGIGITDANGTVCGINFSKGEHNIIVMLPLGNGLYLYGYEDFYAEGNEGYIKANALAADLDNDGRKDDAFVFVYLAMHDPVSRIVFIQPIEGAAVYVDSDFVGITDANGTVSAFNYGAGDHKVFAAYKITGWPVFLYASDRFYSEGDSNMYIFTNALTICANNDGLLNDVMIQVNFAVILAPGVIYIQPLANAIVTIDGDFYGRTNAFGILFACNFSEGKHKVMALVYNNDNGTIYLVSKAEFSSVGDGNRRFIFVDTYSFDQDGDGEKDDVIIFVFTGGIVEEGVAVILPIKDSLVFVDGMLYGVTDANGTVVALNLPEGMHKATAILPVSPEVLLYATSDFYSEGSEGKRFLQVRAFAFDEDGDGYKDDALIFAFFSVRLDNSITLVVPFANVNVFIDGEYFGKTDVNGTLAAYNFCEGNHRILGMLTFYDAINDTYAMLYDNTAFKSQGMQGHRFITVTPFTLAAEEDGDGLRNDVLVIVSFTQALTDGVAISIPLDDVDVFVDGKYIGTTNETGVAWTKDLSEGMHRVLAIKHVGGIMLYSDAEFYAEGVKNDPFMQVKAFAFDAQRDGNKNDVIIITFVAVPISDGFAIMIPVKGADVFVDGFYVGKADRNGTIVLFDIPQGDHKVTSMYHVIDGLGAALFLYATDAFYSAGTGEPIMRAAAFAFAADGDGFKNDVMIYTFHIAIVADGIALMIPLANVSVFVDGQYIGLTDSEGKVVAKNFSEGDHSVYCLLHLGGILYLNAKADFYSEGLGAPFIYAYGFVLDEDGDGFRDDAVILIYAAFVPAPGVIIIVPIPNATVFVDGKFVGLTNQTGMLEAHNCSQGVHNIFALYPLVHANGTLYLWAHGAYYSEGDGEIIYANAYTFAADADGKQNDLQVVVYFASDFQNGFTIIVPLVNASVYVDGELAGYTNDSGVMTAYNYTSGDHDLTTYYKHGANATVHAHATFHSDNGEDYIYIEPYIFDADGDGYADDAYIYVYYVEHTGTGYEAIVLLSGAFVYVDGRPIGATNESGNVTVYNLTAGEHNVTANYTGGRGGRQGSFSDKATFRTEGSSGYIYAVPAVRDNDHDGFNDDLVVYVYDQDDHFVAGASVYLCGVLVGTTDSEGRFTLDNLARGTHTDCHVEYNGKTAAFSFISEGKGAANVAPVANAGSAITITEATSATLSSSTTDANGDTLFYVWTFTEGEAGQRFEGATFTHTFNTPGTYTITLTVFDGVSSSASTVVVTVNAAIIIVANAGSDRIANEDEEVALSAFASTIPDGANITWNFGDSGLGYGMNVSHAYAKQGNYTVMLNISLDGKFSVATIAVRVNNVPPTANAGADVKGTTGKALTFSAAASTDTPSDRNLLVYMWNFGDGTNATGMSVTHKFTKASKFPVTLTVTDDDGAISTSTIYATITKPPSGGGGCGAIAFGLLAIGMIAGIPLIIYFRRK